MSENDYDDCLRPRKRSLVWHFFEKLSRTRVRCRMCCHEQNYQGTTGNILAHLKSKHELDATIKGQQSPKNQERLRLLLNNVASLTIPITEIKIERRYSNKNSLGESQAYKITPYEEDTSDVPVKPTTTNTGLPVEEPFEEYMCEDELLHDPNNDDTWDPPNISVTSKNKRKTKLDDELVAAEAEYYRQKAGYFKLQKFLTALQAKKIKIEIEQLNHNNNNNSSV
uniref:BED-type domain-containing protein n=1 Tax=Stomoxys calcitrans TaxID=35570 RepID=A0A1I8PM25_STOCA